MQQRAHSVHIGALVLVVAAELFGGHEAGRAGASRAQAFAAEPRQAEVEHLDAPFAGDTHIGRLQIAVENAFCVGVQQRHAHAQRDAHRGAGRERAAGEPAVQRLSPQELHHQRGHAAEEMQVEDGDDVRVLQPRNHLRLAA